MQNVNELLKELGLEIPQDKAEEFSKKFSENYKTIAEFDKKLSKVEEERDNFKGRLETAENTLKGFEGVNVEDMKKQMDAYKESAAQAERDFNKKIEERDFNDALREALQGYKFTSSLARDAVADKIKSSGLKLTDGKIIGLSEMMESLKESNKDAFSDDNGKPKAQFTSGRQENGGKKYSTREEIMKIADTAERQKAISENLELFN